MQAADVFYTRNPSTSLMITKSEVLAVGMQGDVFSLQNHTERLRQLFDLLRTARSIPEIARLMALRTEEVEQLLSRLLKHGIVLSGTAETLDRIFSPQAANTTRSCVKCLVVGISGTFQLVGSSFLGMIASLKGSFANEVHVVLTDGAVKFIKPEIFSYYGLPVWANAFETRDGVNVPHMWLAARANIIFVAATANTIHRLAVGACSDLLSLMVAATRAPVVVAPAMNPLMLSDPAVARNVNQLRNDGMYVAEPNLGRELSNTSDGRLVFGGLGVPIRGLVPMLAAVLARRAAQEASPSDDKSLPGTRLSALPGE